MALDLLMRFAHGMGLRKAGPVSPWRKPVRLDHGRLGEACLALDGHGHGSVVWENGGRLWTMPIGSRSTPALARLPLGEGTAPQIQLNTDGRGLALWQTQRNGERQIQGQFLGPEESSAKVVFQTAGVIRHLQGRVDRRGNALVVWCLDQSGQTEVLAQSFEARKQTWEQAPARLGVLSLPTAGPRMAVNQKEHAMVLWEMEDGVSEGLVASHYWPTDRIWSDRPVPVVPHATRHHQVAMDDAGNALALWIHAPYGQRCSLEASFYDALASEWGEPELLANARSFSAPRLVMTGEGRALAAWCQSEGHGPSRLFAKAFAKGQWESALDCVELGQAPIRDFAISLGADGSAGILAVHHGPEGDWVSARLRQGEWSAPLPLMPASSQPCAAPRLSLSSEGSSALWTQGEGREKVLYLAETR
jgi:hypothetical protein